MDVEKCQGSRTLLRSQTVLGARAAPEADLWKEKCIVVYYNVLYYTKILDYIILDHSILQYVILYHIIFIKGDRHELTASAGGCTCHDTPTKMGSFT